MCEQTEIKRKRKAILMWPSQADLYLIREREGSYREVRERKMSMKEKKEAIISLLKIIREHEGEWSANRIIAEMAVKHGLKTETVQGYVAALIVIEQIERQGENLYIKKG